VAAFALEIAWRLFWWWDKLFRQLGAGAKEILLHLFDKELLRLWLPGLETVFIEQHFGVLGPHPPGFGAYVFIDLLPQFGIERGFIQAGEFAAEFYAFHHTWHGDIVTRAGARRVPRALLKFGRNQSAAPGGERCRLST
jgi:hypothetical protein